ADVEVVGVVEGGLGAKGAGELEVLLDLGALVVEAETGLDAFGEDAGTKGPRRRAVLAQTEATFEEELNAIGAADVEVVADDLLEELGSVNGPVEDVGGADFHLH